MTLQKAVTMTETAMRTKTMKCNNKCLVTIIIACVRYVSCNSVDIYYLQSDTFLCFLIAFFPIPKNKDTASLLVQEYTLSFKILKNQYISQDKGYYILYTK